MLANTFKEVKPISKQLGIGLADLAIQSKEWVDPVGFMLANFNAPDQLLILIEFLNVLPEELLSNSKITMEVFLWIS
jgi:hypothetical protein